MKIILLGAGKVGKALLDVLTPLGYQIVVIDKNKKILENVHNDFDVQTVLGDGCLKAVLEDAGAKDASLFIASTPSDEVNIVACHNAEIFFKLETKIARLSKPSYIENQNELFFNGTVKHFIDAIFSPEILIADYLSNIISYPSVMQIKDFANHRIAFFHIKIFAEFTIINHSLKEFLEKFKKSEAKVKILALFRGDKSLDLNDDTIIEEDDELFLVADKQNLPKIMEIITGKISKIKNILIIGGGLIGSRTALKLSANYKIKLIEKSPQICVELSTTLNKFDIDIINGDATELNILHEANINSTDCICALTDSDETNLIMGVIAKDFGVDKTIALVNKNYNYYSKINNEKNLLDTIFSPKYIISSHILSYIIKGKIIRIDHVRGDSSLIMEVIIKEDSDVRNVAIIDLPAIFDNVVIASIIRDNEIITNFDANFVLQFNDYMLILIVDNTKSVLDDLIEYF